MKGVAKERRFRHHDGAITIHLILVTSPRSATRGAHTAAMAQRIGHHRLRWTDPRSKELRRMHTPHPAQDIVPAFLQAMHAHGIVPDARGRDALNADGALVRFHVEGDRRGTRNGWAVLFGDHVPAGEFGSWRTGARHAWCAKSASALTVAEQRSIRQRQDAARTEREQQQRGREEDAAKAANVLWNRALPAEANHPYLVRKGIQAHGLRVSAWPIRNSQGLVFRHIANALLVPVMNATGRIVSLQAIFPRHLRGPQAGLLPCHRHTAARSADRHRRRLRHCSIHPSGHRLVRGGRLGRRQPGRSRPCLARRNA
jgi:hypothetical protein